MTSKAHDNSIGDTVLISASGSDLGIVLEISREKGTITAILKMELKTLSL